MTCHASAVSYEGRGVLIVGASATGKSALALDLVSRGAKLVADDQVQLTRSEQRVALGSTTSGPVMIEARGVGILDLGSYQTDADLAIIVDMDNTPKGRLPHLQHRDLLGVLVPVIFANGVPNLAAVVAAILQGAVLLDPDEPR